MRRWAERLAVVAILLAVWGIQEGIDERRPKRPSSLLYTPDRRLMKVIAFGHGPTLADLTWVQSTSYVMNEFRAGRSHVAHLFALYDVLTDLDPNFVEAYVMGAIFLSAVAQEPERSLELLEKGQGRLHDDGTRVTEDPKHPGRIDSSKAERWRLLGEASATHLVSFASLAPTADERQAEIRLGGRLLVFGAQRYPRSSYPTRPEWYEEVGSRLAVRDLGPRESRLWEAAVRQTWYERWATTSPDSPIHELAARRLAEIEARQRLAVLEAALVAGRPLPADAKDPLGIGFYVVGGHVVSPALDAEVHARALNRLVGRFHAETDRFPATLEDLATWAGALWPVRPEWVLVVYDRASGEVRASARPPSGGRRLVAPGEPR